MARRWRLAMRCADSSGRMTCFMPLLMTSAEGGMLGYALYALLCGADQTKMYAMVDIGQTMFAFTVFLTALKAAGGER